MNGDLISFGSRLQTSPAQSSTEYMALSLAGKELLWIRNILISIGVNSFGFNFNAEESLNGSPPNSEKNAESSGSDNDSGGKNQAKLAVVSSEASSLTTKMKGSVRTIRENTGAMRKEHGSSNHQQKRKAASMSLTSRRSSSGSGSDFRRRAHLLAGTDLQLLVELWLADKSVVAWPIKRQKATRINFTTR